MSQKSNKTLTTMQELADIAGDTWRPHAFYEDSLLRALPMVMDELPRNAIFSPAEEAGRCYTWRTLVHFAGFFGAAAVEPVSDKRLCQ